MRKLDGLDLAPMFAKVGAVMAENAEALCAMDAEMGDGDLGLTMNKGFNALPGILDGIDEPDIGKKLAKAGLKMSSAVPSTMGTLMASGIMGAGKALTGRTEIDSAGFVVYLDGFAQGIAKRGKCAPGDRTVLDAILPAARRAAEAAKQDNATLEMVMRAALEGADAGVEATKAMTPKFGKAVVHSAKAMGVADQGAWAARLMIQGYLEFVLAGEV